MVQKGCKQDFDTLFLIIKHLYAVHILWICVCTFVF